MHDCKPQEDKEFLPNTVLYQENYQLIQKYYPAWLPNIDAAESPYCYAVSRSQSGEPSLCVTNGVSVAYHSRYKPREEAQRLLASVQRDIELLVVGGLGLGYLLEEALSLFECEVFLWDWDWMVLKQCMSTRPMKLLLSHPRSHLVFSESPQALVDALKPSQTQKMQLLVHKASEQLYPRHYQKLREAFYYFKSSRDMNIATLNRFERLWTRNILKNLPDFLSYQGIAYVSGLLKNIPCVIVAAGPSLMKNIHELHRAKGRAVIICVDTSFQILQAHGIDPDFVLAVDPQDINKKYFEYLKPSKAILVVEPSVSPKIFRQYPGRKLILGSVFHLVRCFEKLSGEKGKLDIGGSVATAAYGLALRLGASPIIFTGLDLAYSQYQTHMKGSYFEENWFYSWTRFQNNYTRTRELLSRCVVYQVQDCMGHAVWTDKKFQMFQSWFEAKFQESQCRIINASEGGLTLKHTVSMPLAQALDQYLATDSENLRALDALDTRVPDALTVMKNSLNTIEELLSHCTYLVEEVKRAQVLVQELYALTLRRQKQDLRTLFLQSQDIHQQLDSIDERIKSNMTVNALISVAIQSTINTLDQRDSSATNTNAPKNPQLDNLTSSILLYDKIYDALLFNVKHFTRTTLLLQSCIQTKKLPHTAALHIPQK